MGKRFPRFCEERRLQPLPYKGKHLPDDIVRLILKYAAEDGIAAREVCKKWLNISNSLTPLFLNRMQMIQSANYAMLNRLKILKAALHDEDEDGIAWFCEVSKARLMKKCQKETLTAMCTDFGIPKSGTMELLAENLSEQLHYETDTSDDDA